MTKALTQAFVNSKLVQPEDILVASPSGRTFEFYKNLGIQTTQKNLLVLETCEIVFYAAKPYQFESIKEKICVFPTAKVETLVSIAAGISIEQLKNFITARSQQINVIRCMPNTPCMVNKGCFALCSDLHTENGPAHLDLVKRLLSSCGIVEELASENLINAVCGLSGSGPAFIFSLIEAMSDAGVRNGLPRDIATKFAAQTFAGAAEMVLSTGQHPGELKDQVTSSGGTTIHGIRALERNGGRYALFDAVDSATNRAIDIEQGNQTR